MMLYSFMKFMISIIDALLALHIVSAQVGAALNVASAVRAAAQDGLPKIMPSDVAGSFTVLSL